MSKNGYCLESLRAFLQEACRRYEQGQREPSSGISSRGAGGKRSSGRYPPHMAPDSEIDVAWDEVARRFDEGEEIEAIVTGWNRGGLLALWDNKLQGFIPISQLTEIPTFEDEASRDEELARWVGEVLDLRIIELDRSRNRLIFSQRATLWNPNDGERVLAELSPGDTCTGYVSNICDFGAFVDLGGIDGLVHISELSWGRVNHPSEVLSMKQEVEVYVLDVDRENERIALSIKRLKQNPWETVQKEFTVGQTVQATVTNIVEFGAFARIKQGVEGLVHISEMAAFKVEHPSEIVDVGDRIYVRILDIDCARHRLSLSMRQAGS
ncbi:MAG: S1 RNA-binding domain-containing protein [Chloroflexota bacterium]|nr:S1 RNA-binding domain-containing protein [Chloroflexota bacterium]